jgi:1,4-alpha-glucan branching enzyme
MPVKEFPGDRSWGYNPRYFFAAESSYGTTFDLKRLIDEFMDVVFA